MSRRAPFGQSMGGGGGTIGTGRPMTPDMMVLLIWLFVTFTFQFFDFTAIVPGLLCLTPLALKGFVWQVVTYPFTGFGGGFAFLLELLIFYWFGNDVLWRLGRRRFWSLILWTSVGSATIAILVHLLGSMLSVVAPAPFFIMQGQQMLVTIAVAAFATIYGEGTILLFFVVPIKARWFLGLEILFAFIAFLGTKDYPGFIGLCAAVGLTYLALAPGGPRLALRNLRLRIKRWMVERKLARMRRDRRFEVVDNDRDRWLH